MIRLACSHCGRTLKKARASGMGPVCEGRQGMKLRKPVKTKRARVHVEASEFDERQLTLNLEVSYG